MSKKPIVKQSKVDVDYAKNFVDLVCSENISDLTGESCDVQSLQKFADLNGIKWNKGDNKKTLCLKIAFKYEKDELVRSLATCQKSIDDLVVKSTLTKSEIIQGDIIELQTWWNKNLTAAKSAIETENLIKTREFKNLVRQTCDSFVTGINNKIDKELKGRKKTEKFFKLF